MRHKVNKPVFCCKCWKNKITEYNYHPKYLIMCDKCFIEINQIVENNE